ncbi:TetR/AcrR family transcriptional regulator [Streptomyces sp. 150FB]|uniref:TetR/AcrR family transcriptional regulator n=1 Tax=Streptomyces sp. 150FB TaxID=1576605 RepID=UPI000697A9C5|nr:TetR/AcrR family transcriptional regulator [Streptomyces sp. 150FB]
MPSITRNPSQGPERRAAVETKVFAAVEALLAQGMSYTEISVQRIISEADIARSTFYVHFRDKTDLLSRLAGTIRRTLFGLSDWKPPAGPEGLIEAFERVIAYHREHYDVLSAMAEVAAYDPTVRDFYTSNLEEFDARTRKSLADEQRAGLVPAGLDPTAASRIIVWGGEQAIAHHIRVDDGSGDAALARELSLIWWHGAYRRGTE